MWNNGDMPKGFVISARNPWNIWFVVKTSLVTSFVMPSMVPGFDRPNASLFSVRDVYLSIRDVVTALLSKKLSGELSSIESIVKIDVIKENIEV